MGGMKIDDATDTEVNQEFSTTSVRQTFLQKTPKYRRLKSIIYLILILLNASRQVFVQTRDLTDTLHALQFEVDRFPESTEQDR